ncbi:MAG: hypothetical protein JJT78_11550 [Leptospira sp.]|nr:hypothetical protein [Leptospira sp.]
MKSIKFNFKNNGRKLSNLSTQTKIGNFMSIIIISFSILSFGSCKLPQKDIEPQPIGLWLDKVRYGWAELPHTKSLCPDFDYFPGGGIQNFYCHLKDISSFSEIEKFFGQAIFLSGPHKNGFLILDDDHSFGHYNPEFPKFLKRTMIPGSQDRAFAILTQPIYNEYLRNLARIYYATYLKLQSNQVYLTKERIRYKKLIQQKTLERYYYEKYYSFMETGFTDDENANVSSRFKTYSNDSEFDGNVVKSAVLFWIRRSIDGTDKEFVSGLKVLLLTYDADFIKSR